MSHIPPGRDHAVDHWGTSRGERHENNSRMDHDGDRIIGDESQALNNYQRGGVNPNVGRHTIAYELSTGRDINGDKFIGDPNQVAAANGVAPMYNHATGGPMPHLQAVAPPPTFWGAPVQYCAGVYHAGVSYCSGAYHAGMDFCSNVGSNIYQNYAGPAGGFFRGSLNLATEVAALPFHVTGAVLNGVADLVSNVPIVGGIVGGVVGAVGDAVSAVGDFFSSIF